MRAFAACLRSGRESFSASTFGFATRGFSTGKYFLPASGKLHEKVKRRLELKKQKEKQRLAERASTYVRVLPKDLAAIKANAALYLRWEPGIVPAFNFVQRNRFGRIVEPTTQFRLVVTTSKNNVWITAQSVRRDPGIEGELWPQYRTLFVSFAGCYGIRGRDKQRPAAAELIGEKFSAKCRRFGITDVSVVFRNALRITPVLRGLIQRLRVKSVVHAPRIARGKPLRVRKRRRV